jgi:hypothetical protein
VFAEHVGEPSLCSVDLVAVGISERFLCDVLAIGSRCHKLNNLRLLMADRVDMWTAAGRSAVEIGKHLDVAVAIGGEPFRRHSVTSFLTPFGDDRRSV